MSVQIVQTTAATGLDVTPKTDNDVGTSVRQTWYGPAGSITRPRLLVASFALSALLTPGSVIPTVPPNYTGRRRYEATIESGTVAVECDPELVDQIRELFKQGASEFFQDGVHSHFSRVLLATIAQHSHVAFRGIYEYLVSSDANADVMSEALRWLADFNDPATFAQRWSILQRALRSRSSRVRDGAILGFAALDDPRARPLLLEARNVEQIPELQRLIDKAVEQLGAATDDPAPPYGSTESLV